MARQSTIDRLTETLTELTENKTGAYFGNYGEGTGWVLVRDREGWFRRDMKGDRSEQTYHEGEIALVDISKLVDDSFDMFFASGGVRREGESDAIFSGLIAYEISDCSEESWAIVRAEEVEAIKEIFGQEIEVLWVGGDSSEETEEDEEGE